MRIVAKLVFFVALIASGGVSGTADPYPQKPVRLIVPFAAGGGTDALARLVAKKLTDKWGHQVVVENRAGAEGVIGSALVAQAPADGYTLLWAVQSHAIMPSVRLNMPYDTLKAFAPITQVAGTPYVIVVSNKVEAKNISELIAAAKSNPNKLSFGSSDPGARIMGELFKAGAGIDIVNVSYKGSSPILTDLLGSHIEMGFVSLPSAMQYHKNKTLKLVAVSTAQRSPLAPELPTLAESGIKEFDISIWWGMLAPAGTPADIVMKIHRDLVQIAAETDFKAEVERAGAIPVLSAPPEFAKFLSEAMERAAKTARQAGIKAE